MLKETPKNWYTYNLSLSIELLHKYIEGVELQASQSIKDFRDNKEEITTEHPPNEDYWEYIEIHRGLSDDTWDLHSIFEEYFPTLQRGSALITLFSFIEHELENLCHLFSNEKEIKIKVNDLHGKGINRSINYLKKVTGLKIDTSIQIWEEIKSIQKIRNLIVHNSGILHNKHKEPMKIELEYISKTENISEKDFEVFFEAGYLFHALETFDNFCKIIDKEIRQQEKT